MHMPNKYVTIYVKTNAAFLTLLPSIPDSQLHFMEYITFRWQPMVKSFHTSVKLPRYNHVEVDSIANMGRTPTVVLIPINKPRM